MIDVVSEWLLTSRSKQAPRARAHRLRHASDHSLKVLELSDRSLAHVVYHSQWDARARAWLSVCWPCPSGFYINVYTRRTRASIPLFSQATDTIDVRFSSFSALSNEIVN